LDRLKQRSVSAIAQAQAEFGRAQASAGIAETRRLKELTSQLALTKMIAPQDGLVVYASTVSAFGGSRSKKALTVRLRQEIISSPTLVRCSWDW